MSLAGLVFILNHLRLTFSYVKIFKLNLNANACMRFLPTNDHIIEFTGANLLKSKRLTSHLRLVVMPCVPGLLDINGW